MRVLVVEDEPIIALNIQTILLDLGYRPVGPAGTISEAEALADQRRIDAAILDITLPDGKSYDLAEQLVSRNVPVLFLTGAYVETRSARLANVPTMSKPFDLATFEQAMADMAAKVAGNREALSQS